MLPDLVELWKESRCYGSGLLGGIIGNWLASCGELTFGYTREGMKRLFSDELQALLANHHLARAARIAQCRAMEAVCVRCLSAHYGKEVTTWRGVVIAWEGIANPDVRAIVWWMQQFAREAKRAKTISGSELSRESAVPETAMTTLLDKGAEIADTASTADLRQALTRDWLAALEDHQRRHLDARPSGVVEGVMNAQGRLSGRQLALPLTLRASIEAEWFDLLRVAFRELLKSAEHAEARHAFEIEVLAKLATARTSQKGGVADPNIEGQLVAMERKLEANDVEWDAHWQEARASLARIEEQLGAVGHTTTRIETKIDALHNEHSQNFQKLRGMIAGEIAREATALPRVDFTTGRSELAPHASRRRRGRVALTCAAMVWCALFIWREVWPPPAIDPVALRSLLMDNSWITYDPVGMRFAVDGRPVFPDVAQLTDDLEAIRSQGFNGILTSGATGEMANVPEIAKGKGLKVIMGIWNPSDPQELDRAIRAAKFVDAYCVGDSQAIDGHDIRVLRRALWVVKKRTGLPATVSDVAKRYDDGRFAQMGDWVFPDAHLGLLQEGRTLDPRVDAVTFLENTKDAARSARMGGRLLLFKNVAYPHSGAPGASRENQALFFRELLKKLHDPETGHGIKSAIVVQSAFDAPWKIGKPYYSWDPFTSVLLDRRKSGMLVGPGILGSDAAVEVLSWYRRGQERGPP